MCENERGKADGGKMNHGKMNDAKDQDAETLTQCTTHPNIIQYRIEQDKIASMDENNQGRNRPPKTSYQCH